MLHDIGVGLLMGVCYPKRLSSACSKFLIDLRNIHLTLTAMVLFGVEILYCASWQGGDFFHDNLSPPYFFLQKQTILRDKMLSKKFFLSMSETEIFFNQSCWQKNVTPTQKKKKSIDHHPSPQVKWVVP